MAWIVRGNRGRLGKGRAVKACCLVIVLARNGESGGPPRPGEGREVGREKPRVFQCRSNLSNLSIENRKKRRVMFLFRCRIFSKEGRPPPKTPRDSLSKGGQAGLGGPRQQLRALLSSNFGISRLDDALPGWTPSLVGAASVTPVSTHDLNPAARSQSHILARGQIPAPIHRREDRRCRRHAPARVLRLIARLAGSPPAIPSQGRPSAT
jgi:hypothetical protein